MVLAGGEERESVTLRRSGYFFIANAVEVMRSGSVVDGCWSVVQDAGTLYRNQLPC
jgi:hypothetical protein